MSGCIPDEIETARAALAAVPALTAKASMTIAAQIAAIQTQVGQAGAILSGPWNGYHYPSHAAAIADATADTDPTPVGTVVTVYDFYLPGERGGYIGVVEDDDHPFNPLGQRIRPTEWWCDRAWGVVHDGAHDPKLDTYSPSGTPNAVNLQRYINFCKVLGRKPTFSGGMIYADDHLYFRHDATHNPLPSAAGNAYSGLVMEGGGPSQYSHSQNGIVAPAATTILMAPGKQIFADGGAALSLIDVEVRFSRPDGKAIDFGNALIQGGKLERFKVTNFNQPSGDPNDPPVSAAAVSSRAVFYLEENQGFYIGTGNFRDRHDNPDIHDDDLYAGRGREFLPDTGGSSGEVKQSLAAGFRYGWVYGYPFDPDYDGAALSAIVQSGNSASYCHGGMLIGPGAGELDFEKYHIEHVSWFGLELRRGSGPVTVTGGSISGTRRASNLTDGFARDGMIFVRGGAGKLIVDLTKFNALTQPAILVEADERYEPTEIIVRNAQPSANGGALVGVIDMGGGTNITIENPGSVILPNRIVGYTTRNTELIDGVPVPVDYSRHSFDFAPELARVIGAPSGYDPVVNTDTDLSGNVALPEYLKIATTASGAGRSLTFGPNSNHQDTDLYKFQDSGSMLLAPAKDMTLIDAATGTAVVSTDEVPHIEVADTGLVQIKMRGDHAHIIRG